MSRSEKFVVQDGQVYGRLQAGFQIELGEKGYFSIAGLNNSGKTTVLQWLLTQSQNSIYIPAERGTVRPTLDSGTLRLTQYVGTFRDQASNGPIDTVYFSRGSVGFGSSVQIREMDSYPECLLSSMIRDKGITDSVTELGQYVKQFLLVNFDIALPIFWQLCCWRISPPLAFSGNFLMVGRERASLINRGIA